MRITGAAEDARGQMFALQRREMVERQIVARGVTAPAVLQAMGTIPREHFVPEQLVMGAYADSPVHIGAGQTIVQPFVAAIMLEALQVGPGNRVLEIGTGSGYTAAVLSLMVAEVYTVERIRPLAEKAALLLNDLGCGNVRVLHDDGYHGWPDYAPFDAILVTAGCTAVPPPLQDQLADRGRMVIPLGADMMQQNLVRIRRISQEGFLKDPLGQVCFVPMARGRYGSG